MLYNWKMSDPTRPARIGFLLTQLGTLAAELFAAKTRELGITPAEAGVLRIVGRQAGINQRELAERLGLAPSRMVPLIDSLQASGLVIRSRSATDRRNQELQLTEQGQELLANLRAVAEEQEAAIAEGLDPADRAHLYELLLRLSAARGLDSDVHPGYRS
ncbi:MAG: MarR family transcriptional regulator [Micrococcaceae bacterium]|nr:MarR family transcriptional regulator [Micrococcaceae bacterium]